MVTYMSNVYVICVLGILICGGILFRTVKNYKLLKHKYMELQTSICLSNCSNEFFKTEDFFFMKNSGSSPCEPLEKIEYVDYIGSCNIFMERNDK